MLSPQLPRAPDDELRSVRTWVRGHSAPLLAIEVVSTTNPNKDYVIAPDKYAASGVRELWIFDPLLAGPRSHGGPFRLQIWCRDEQGRFVRSHAGEGPARSEALDAHAVTIDGGHRLRIADDPGGDRPWPTDAEAQAAKVAELEAQLAKSTGRSD